MQAVIICGGYGSRLNKIYKQTPKALIKFKKKPNLDHIIKALKKNNITEYLFLTKHLNKKIIRFLKKKKINNAKILQDRYLSGTGGALLEAIPFLKKEFLVIYSDLFINFDYKKFIKFAKNKKANVCIAVHANSHPFDSDTVEYDSNFKIIKIVEKNTKQYKENNSIAGIFYFKKSFLSEKNFRKYKTIDIVKNLLSIKIKNKIFAYKTLDYIKDFGTPGRINLIKKEIRKKIINYKIKKNAVFLDRDGVINKEIGGVTKLDQFKIINGVGKAINLLNKRNIPCFIVSNQAQIAKGLLKISTLKKINCTLDLYLSKFNAYIDDFLICPNFNNKKITKKNVSFFWKDRKPHPGMIKELAKRHNINLKKSYFIGDSDLDILCGKKCKMKTILVDSPRNIKYILNVKPNYYSQNLLEAVKNIIIR